MLVAIGGLQVVFRFVLDNPLAWVLEVSVILMVWATMLSGYVGVRRNSHLSADFLGLSMKPATRWALDGLTMLLCLVFLARLRMDQPGRDRRDGGHPVHVDPGHAAGAVLVAAGRRGADGGGLRRQAGASRHGCAAARELG